MNFIMLYPSEIEAGSAVVCGPRAAKLCEVHELSEGLVVQALVWGQSRGEVAVLEVRPELVVMRYREREALLARPRTVAIVGLSRPQTVKKVLALSAAMGVTELHLVRSEGSPKSYLQSHTLQQEELHRELVKGMEQSGDPIPPAVQVHPHFHIFVDQLLHSGDLPKLKLAADTRASQPITSAVVRFEGSAQGVVFAIGPEAGWEPRESQALETLGFTPCSLGARILRVEHALAALLGQIALRRADADSGI